MAQDTSSYETVAMPLLVTNDPLSEAEKKIISKPRFIASDAQTALYELPLTALDATPHRSAALRDMASYSARPDIVRHSWIISVDNSPFGTHTLIGFNNTEIYSGVILQAQDTTTYEASIWIRVAGMEGMPVIHIQEMDSQTAETHRRNIRQKLGAESAFELGQFARAFDLI